MTVIEMLVVLALASIFVVLAMEMRGSVARQAAQTEQGADMIREALILQERLTADLEESLALQVLPEEERPRGQVMTTLHLPIYAAYRGNEVPSLKFQKRTYVWDAEKKQLTRDGKVVLRQGIRALRFRWSTDRPTMLEVELEGERGNRDKGQHQGAAPSDTPAPQPTNL
jgi:hypothetical protein